MKTIRSLVVAAALASAVALPTFAAADHHHHHHGDSGKGWRDLALLGGAAGVAGLATHNSTLALAGGAGAAYSALRWSQDRSHYHRSSGHGWDRHHDHGWHDSHGDHRYDAQRNHHGW